MSELVTHQTDWIIDGDVLKKNFRYNDLTEPRSVHYSRIQITKSQSLLTKKFNYIFDFVFSPNPWPDVPDGVVLGKLCLGERVAEQSWVKLSVGHQDGCAVLSTASNEGLRTFLLCLGECRPMRLIIDYGLGKPLDILIPNDAQFSTMAQNFFV